MTSFSLDQGRFRLSFRYIKPSRLMFETGNLGLKIPDKQDALIHDHLPIIINRTKAKYLDSELPEKFRAEWLIQISETDNIKNEIWVRLMISISLNVHAEITHLWIDKLTGQLNQPIDFYIEVANYLPELLNRSIENFKTSYNEYY